MEQIRPLILISSLALVCSLVGPLRAVESDAVHNVSALDAATQKHGYSKVGHLLAAIKSSSRFVAPFALAAVARDQMLMGRKPDYLTGFRPINRLAAGALGAMLVIGAAGYLAFGWDWLHAFGLAGENQGRTSHLSIPVTFARLTGIDESVVRVVALGLLGVAVLWLLVRTWRGADWIRATAWAGTGLLLATSWLLPWTLLWPLPLAAVARDRFLVFLLLALTAYQLGARIPL